MSRRLIIVSNRIPLGETSGGLVVALHEALSESGGIWIGAHEELVDDPDDSLESFQSEPYEKLTFRLSAHERRTYYEGYANSVLWPLCHRRTDLIDVGSEDFEGYLAVNRRVARAVARLARKNDLIWVQDYHFLPLAQALRDEGVETPIGLFLHIPFPVLADISALPQSDRFPNWIAQFDLVGLQTQADVARCLEMYRGLPFAEPLFESRIKYDDRVFSVRSFPIGIDAKAFTTAAEGPIENLGLAAEDRLMIGVDRLDYSKGIPNRVRAVGRYLEIRSPEAPRPVFLQIAPPSRETVAAYQDVRDELELLAGRINGTYAEVDWTPVRYIHRALPRERLAPLYRAARVGLVTPMVDGMNLVAKEYVAAQDPEDPGVLILSMTAGAAESLTQALIVNPHDIDAMARAIARALLMPLGERKSRHAELLADVQKNDIGWWWRAFVSALRNSERPLQLRSSDARPRSHA